MLQAVLLASSLSGDLGRDVMRLAGAVALLLLLPLLLVVVVVAAMVAPLSTGGVSSSESPPVAADRLAVVLEVSARSGVPWELLAAIASVENRPVADSLDYSDAIGAIARDLVAAGVGVNIPQAVYARNRSWHYVSLVLARARLYSASGLVAQSASTSALEVAP